MSTMAAQVIQMPQRRRLAILPMFDWTILTPLLFYDNSLPFFDRYIKANRMKRHIRIGLAAAAIGATALAYPFLAAAQIATPEVSAVPGASADISFELFRGSRIVLNGRVNGVDTPMMLDSGAGVTTLDDDFAKKIGLKKGTAISAQGAGGSEPGELVQDVTI